MSTYFVNSSNKKQWFQIWHALAVVLSGGPVTQPLTEKEITILVSGWVYEGSEKGRGHCFTNRAASGRKSYLWVEA